MRPAQPPERECRCPDALADPLAGKPAYPPLVRSSLPLDVKRRMVVLFAQFQAVRSVKKAIKQEFDLDLDERTVMNYDPGRGNCRVGRHLREMYHEVRRQWIEETHNIGVAHQAQRLRLIERVVDKATTARDFNAALKGLELAAKEMGGLMTNLSKTEVVATVEHRHSSIEDARAELAMRLCAVLEA